MTDITKYTKVHTPDDKENDLGRVHLPKVTDQLEAAVATLGQDQRTAYDSIVQLFLHAIEDNRPCTAVLTGAAGTGKTYLCDALARRFNPLMCALTNKAAAVMSKETGRDVVTLAKVLKQKKWKDYNTGQVKFKSSAKQVTLRVDKSSPEKKIVFIDEVSMAGKDNLTEILERISPYYLVLLIGDKFQLPPVNEEVSGAFSLPAIPIYELCEPQRQDEASCIYRTGVAIRTALQGGNKAIQGMRELLATPDADVVYMSAEEAAPLMVADFTDMQDVDDVRIISFTNRRVEQFNYHVKFSVTGDPTAIRAGDVLVANETYSVKEVVDNKEDDDFFSAINGAKEQDVVRIRNNEAVLVQSVEEDVLRGIPCYAVTLPNLNVYVPKNRLAFEAQVDRMRKAALAASNPEQRRHLFRQMFEFKEAFADLRVNYAQTVHKAQGSTYKVCYFDLTSLNSGTEMGKKLLYTGVTRASEKLVLFK